MLTNAACKNATCPADKNRIRLSDSGGLYLEIAPNASKRWFWKYYFASADGLKEKRLALGSYPAVSLKDAREARDDARKMQQAGIDPAQQRQIDKLESKERLANNFEAVAREYHATHASGWSPRYAARWIERMEKDLFPWIGSLPLDDISAPLLLKTLRRVEARGAIETAHTLRQTSGQVFKLGIQTGRCERNPAPDLSGALQPVVVKHMPAILDPERAGVLMLGIEGYHGQPATRVALALSAYIFQRPGNVRGLEWHWLDLDKAMLEIPSAQMKRTKDRKINGRPHFVPLAKQCVRLLRELHPLTGHGRFVFPGLHNHERPMSENTVNLALRRMGFSGDEMVAHGFRSMARTIMVEHTDIEADVIEAQLAHGKRGPLGEAYDRAQYMSQRRKMMQHWADYLDRLKGQAMAPSGKAA